VTNKHYLALSAISLQAFGAGVSGIAILFAATNIAEVTGTTVVVACSLAGVALGGLSVGAIAHLLSTQRVLLISEVIRVFCVLCLFAFDLELPWVGLLALGLSLVSSVSNANRWDILFKSPAFNNKKIYNIQQAEIIAGILSPLAAGYIASVYGVKYAYLSSLIILSFGCVAWFIFCSKITTFSKPKSNHFSGYAIIFQSKQLSSLILLRILTGSSVVIWSIYLPSVLRAMYGNDFPSFQGELAAMSAIAVALSGFLMRNDSEKQWTLQRFVFIAAISMFMHGLSMCIFVGMVKSYWALSLAALAFGCYVPTIRASIVQIGKLATPSESVSEVVSAGDSMVRIVNFVVSISFGLLLSLLKSDNERAALFFTMTIVSTLAALALRNLITSPDVRCAKPPY